MDNSESTAKTVDMTYKNIIDDFGPCAKQLVSAGRIYLKTLHATASASRQYTEALSKVASLATNSTFNGSADIGASLYSIVDVNKEMMAQQSNLIKSLEFDFLEPLEIAAEKDTKLLGREQKRFQQLYKARRDAYLKCISTLKKTKRKKHVTSDKQLSTMKMLESAKERLELFCNDSLKEAIIQERVMYGTVLEKQCLLNRKMLTYLIKSDQMIEDRLPQWEDVAGTRDKLSDSLFTSVPNGDQPSPLDSLYALDSMLDTVIRNNSIARSYGKDDRHSMLSSHTMRLPSSGENIYARPLIRAKSEYSLPINAATLPKDIGGKKYNRMGDYNEDDSATDTSFAKALYSYKPTGHTQMALNEGDILEYIAGENTSDWQFGNNLTTGKSGWFPICYTEQIHEVRESAKHFFSDEFGDIKPPPPPSPSTIISVRQNGQSHDVSEYATLTRGRKLIPVKPPIVSSKYDNRSNGSLKKQYASQPNIFEAVSKESSIGNGVYNNGQFVPSMRL